MSRFTEQLAKTRNMGICAHVDAGKTTTTERFLYHTRSHGKHKIGDVDEGNTTTDFMVQEKERGITIQSACVDLTYRDHRINLIDTPGHIDFGIEVERSMRVLDGIVLVLCAKGGVQPQTRTVWRQANRYRVPRIIFVNKMDATGADFYRVVGQIEGELKAKPAVIELPIGNEREFRGVIDLLANKALIWDASDETGETFEVEEIPAELAEKAAAYRKTLVELVAEGDDALLERYLNDEEITAAELKAALRQATVQMRLVPVLCGSAFKNKAVQPLLDAVVDYLPSPLDVDAVRGTTPDGTATERRTSDEEPLCALAFKVANDPDHGNTVLTFVRVYSGVLKAGSHVYNSSKDGKERVSRLLKLQGASREEVDELRAGDIGACVGLKNTTTGDTLADEEKPILLEGITTTEPVFSQAVEPKKRDDADKLANALAKLSLEDPSFRFGTDAESGQLIISGQGELHLEIKVDILKRTYGVEVSTGMPQVSYRETVRGKAPGVGKFVRQTGGHGMYGHAEIELEPLPKGTGFEFVDAITGGVIPREFIPSVEKGIREALQQGVLAGFPVVDVRATLVFGSYHDVDSSDQAFKVAGSMAFKDAFLKAQPVLLEPVMEVVVEVPEKFMGEVIGDISSRRGKVVSTDIENGTATVTAHVPLSALFGYATVLRGKTQGQGVPNIQFSHYEPVPRELSEEIISKARR